MTDLTDFMGTTGLEEASPVLLVLLIAILIWKLIWYGIAIYKTIEKKHRTWFIVLFVAAFVLSDLGILAIIYLGIHRDKPKLTKKKKK